MTFRFAPAHGPAVASEAMIATSQPAATLAGLDLLRRGANAVDAAIAAAAVLCVAEPMSTGIGGDAFAVIASSDGVYGMDASGPAPRAASRLPVPVDGPASSVVPGAVHGWAALSDRFGTLGLDTVLAPAIDLARRGVAAGANCSRSWRNAARAPAALGPPPRIGQRITMVDLGRTMELIATGGPDAFYRGAVAQAIADATWLDEADLADYEGAKWVTPMSTTYRDLEVLELPPPTQGIAALEGLALLQSMEPTLVNRARAVGLALEDAFRYVRDGADVAHLLSPAHLSARLADQPILVPEPPGGTVYLCCVDGDGMAVSFIQSIFEHFGSGVVVPGTGIVMNNRAACFEVSGEVIAGHRPYHTIIPGMLVADGRARGPFGVMGSYIQAQAHVQLIASLADGLDPQAALDQPRFRIEQGAIRLEEGLWDRADEFAAAGYVPVLDDDRSAFGGGQAILIEPDHLVGGSDGRKDGVALGF